VLPQTSWSEKADSGSGSIVHTKAFLVLAVCRNSLSLQTASTQEALVCTMEPEPESAFSDLLV
jgi:hypothetical protein